MGNEHRRAKRVDERRALELVLLERTATATGHEFLRLLVRNLCQALNTAGAWVTDYDASHRRLRSLAFWHNGNWVDHYEYAVAGTPCENVIESCQLTHVPDRVVELFPSDPDLPSLGAVSYLGVPMLDVDGSLLGHLAMLDDKPMPNDASLVTVFEVFAQRAAAEVRRLRLEESLRSRERQLASVLDSAMDAVLVVDEEGRIVRANTAATRTLAPNGGPLESTTLATFLTADSERVFHGRVSDLWAQPGAARQHWFPRGLQVRRSDGREFPADACLSCFEADRQRFSVLFLRDVNERIDLENRMRRLAEEADYLRQVIGDTPGDGGLLGRAPSMRRLFEAIRQVAATDATVIIQGETGTGKELIARAIHDGSPRATGPLVRVNCAAIPGTLIESEFFGHEKGAFTGAITRREGRFGLADGGTIFLDEVGELPLDLQAKLLRVLQEGEFEPLGSTRPRKVDVRVVAATHRDLDAMVREGQFRDDLYYRLHVFPLTAPPLRDRPEDLPLLAEAFAKRFASRMGRRVGPLSPTDVERLRRYTWPGNVRELQNVVERALILGGDGALDLARAMPAVPDERDHASKSPDQRQDEASQVLTVTEMRDLERANLALALARSNWKVAGLNGAARLLGMAPSTLASRIKALKITRT